MVDWNKIILIIVIILAVICLIILFIYEKEISDFLTSGKWIG